MCSGSCNMSMNELKLRYDATLAELSEIQRQLREHAILSHRFNSNGKGNELNEKLACLKKRHEEVLAEYDQVSFCLRSRQMHGE